MLIHGILCNIFLNKKYVNLYTFITSSLSSTSLLNNPFFYIKFLYNLISSKPTMILVTILIFCYQIIRKIQILLLLMIPYGVI